VNIAFFQVARSWFKLRGLSFGPKQAAWWLACFLTVCGAVHAAPVLRVLAWPGYVDTDVVRSFERQTGTQVELTVIDSDVALWQKINAKGGVAFDVFAVNTAELQRYIASNRVQPIDPQRIPNTQKQLPRFRQLDAIPGLVRRTSHGSQVFGIPYTYAAMGLIYDKRQITEPPASINSLWDPRYRGKVLVYNGGVHNFSLAAQSLGMNSPFRISAEQLPRTAEQLIALRRNLLGVYNQPEESVRLFVRHSGALMLANYGMQQVQLLKAAGVDVGYTIPQEGALAWLDCWAITRGAHDADLAHAWINHMLSDTASKLLITRQGLSNTVTATEPPANQGPVHWLEPVEDAALREKLWGRIQSGDRLNRVMAP
jgi:putative spermidine/putrescine transport system substrate-binding protein